MHFFDIVPFLFMFRYLMLINFHPLLPADWPMLVKAFDIILSGLFLFAYYPLFERPVNQFCHRFWCEFFCVKHNIIIFHINNIFTRKFFHESVSFPIGFTQRKRTEYFVGVDRSIIKSLRLDAASFSFFACFSSAIRLGTSSIHATTR